MAKKNYSIPKLYPANRDMDKVWFVSFRFFNPETGKYKQFQYRGTLQDAPTRAERIQEGKSMVQAYTDLLAEGWNPFIKEDDKINKQAGLAKDEIFELVELRKPIIRKTTHTAYKYVARAFCNWLRQECKYDILLTAITRKHAQAYADHNIQKGLSPHAYNNHISVLSSFFNDFVEREILTINPFSKIKRLKERDRENVAFTDTERTIIREHLQQQNKRLYYAVQFVYYCMLRRTDLIHLRVGDIDFANKTIRTRGATAKNSRSQSVTIPKSFEKILLEMGLDKADNAHYVFGKNLETGSEQLKKPDIFTDLHNEEIAKLNIRKECTFYCWKHTGAMNLYMATKDPYIVMNQCRHSEITTTMTYLRSLGLVVNELVREANFEF